MKTLIITEKTSVACKIAATARKVLGDFKLPDGKIINDKDYSLDEQKYKNILDKKMNYFENEKYIIAPASGHLFELYQAYDYNGSYKNWTNIPFPFIPEFKIKLKEDKAKKQPDRKAEKCYTVIKKLMDRKDVDCIICATDADREGENIFALIYRYSQCTKPVKRMWANAFEEGDVLKALRELKDWKLYENVKKAGYCRMLSDWQLGANLSAKTTLSLSSGKEILSVGRVQTAVLSEIVRIEDIIQNFNSKTFYKIVGKFQNSNGEKYEGIYEEEVFDNQEDAKKIINIMKNQNSKVSKYIEKDERKFSTPLYDQTSLAIDMSKNFKIDPNETLNITQTLYEKGHTSYPRTSSRYISNEESSKFKQMYETISVINPLSLKHNFNVNDKRIVDSSKVESHSAIIPTINIPKLSTLSQNEKLVYEYIIKKCIAVVFPPSIDKVQNIETSINEYIFKSTGRKEIERGWREIYNIQKEDNSLPQLKKGENVQIISLDIKEVVTKPPTRYNNATILKFMESCGKKIENEEMRELLKNKGIGTGATRANILQRLMSVGYIETKGKSQSICPTQKGSDLIHKLPIEELKNAEFTGQMEYELYKVERGELSDQEYMKKINDLYILCCEKLDKNTNKMILPDKNEIGKCPKCGNSIVHRKGKSKNGKSYDFYGCDGWKEGCKFTINSTIANKKISETQIKTLLEKGSTNLIKGLTNAKKEKFDGYIKLNDNKDIIISKY